MGGGASTSFWRSLPSFRYSFRHSGAPFRHFDTPSVIPAPLLVILSPFRHSCAGRNPGGRQTAVRASSASRPAQPASQRRRTPQTTRIAAAGVVPACAGMTKGGRRNDGRGRVTGGRWRGGFARGWRSYGVAGGAQGSGGGFAQGWRSYGAAGDRESARGAPSMDSDVWCSCDGLAACRISVASVSAAISGSKACSAALSAASSVASAS